MEKVEDTRMREVRGFFQRLLSCFEAFLSEAQAAGQIEKYLLEVVVVKREGGAVLHSAVYAALITLLHTLQEVIENCYSEKTQAIASSVGCPLVSEQYRHRVDCLPGVDETGSQEEEKMSCKTSVTHSQLLCRRSPPLQPTTKETEAANVLMNLSGKATDRATQSRQESCPTPLQSQHSTSKALLYTSPSLGPGRKDIAGRKELATCDEVPQINEKDLLPLATQVLCQFCSRQCEDLVELHEHVLAAHHAAEADSTLVVPQRKVRISTRAMEGVVTAAAVEEHDLLQEQNTSDTDTAMIVLFHEASSIHSAGEKNTKRKGILKRKNCEVGKRSIIADLSYEDSSQENCSEEWQSTVVGDNPETSQPQPDLPALTLPTNSLCDKDQDWLKGQAGRSVTELTPVASGDALAMAVESSQIRLLEDKMTILVCLECSSGFTDPQEYGGHICDANQPLVYRGPDGSVTLADLPSDTPAHHLQASDMRLFPEFFIQQPMQTMEGGGRGLQVVHLSGRTLHLHTSCTLAYLGEQLISFRCPTCENDSDSLTHFLDHLTDGPCMFRCPDCQLVYISLDKLRKHRASLHPSLEDRTCPNCHHVFEKRHQRNKHLKTKCSQRHECVVCSRLLKNEYSLRVHMQSHEEERKHVCKECGAAFHRQAILARHKMRHSGTKPHACPQCEARFYTRQHLSTHLDRHNGLRRFPCSSCNKAYYSKHDRDTHHSKVHCKPHTAIDTHSVTDVRPEHVG